jgi:hypothetical protein
VKKTLGQKLHEAEGALEDQWARQHDAELLEQIRKKSRSMNHLPHMRQTLHSKRHQPDAGLSPPGGPGSMCRSIDPELYFQELMVH